MVIIHPKGRHTPVEIEISADSPPCFPNGRHCSALRILTRRCLARLSDADREAAPRGVGVVPHLERCQQTEHSRCCTNNLTL